MKGSKKNNIAKEKVDLILVGNQNSGKTSLINKFVDQQKSFSHLYTPTLGISLEKRNIVIDHCEVAVHIWDTAGQQKFFSLTKNYFKKADGILIIFDLTDKLSFQKVSSFWINQTLERASEDSVQIIIGNKVDMENDRVVTKEEAQALADKINLPYFETSAKTGQNLTNAIESIVRQCLKKIRGSGETEEQQNKVELNSQKDQNKNKCFGFSFIEKLIEKFKKDS